MRLGKITADITLTNDDTLTKKAVSDQVNLEIPQHCVNNKKCSCQEWNLHWAIDRRQEGTSDIFNIELSQQINRTRTFPTHRSEGASEARCDPGPQHGPLSPNLRICLFTGWIDEEYFLRRACPYAGELHSMRTQKCQIRMAIGWDWRGSRWPENGFCVYRVRKEGENGMGWDGRMEGRGNW